MSASKEFIFGDGDGAATAGFDFLIFTVILTGAAVGGAFIFGVVVDGGFGKTDAFNFFGAFVVVNGRDFLIFTVILTGAATAALFASFIFASRFEYFFAFRVRRPFILASLVVSRFLSAFANFLCSSSRV